MPRRALLFAVALSLLTPGAHARDASTFPDGPVKLMVGFVPGGPTDLYACIAGRVIAEDSRPWSRFLEQNPGIAAAD